MKRRGGYFGHRASLKRLGSLAAAKGVNAVVALLRGKLTAMLLGPEGMGIAALLMSTSTTVQSATGLGLNLSGVKAVASGTDHAALTLRRLFLFASLIAAIATYLLAPWLGEVTFGSADSAATFRILSPGVFFASLATGEFAILQGRRAMDRLARSSAIGAALGLLPAIPLYIYYGVDGIAPSLVAASAILWISLRMAAGRSPEGSRFDRTLARQLVATGAMMMSSMVAGAAVAWLTLVAIRNFSTVAEAGLYQSVNATVARATEIVFAALSLDFFPSLAMVARSDARLNLAINRQTELVALIAAPLAVAIILGAPMIIRLLLDATFLSAVGVMRWLALGALIKALAYPLGYIAFVKDNRRVFVWLEVVCANLVELALPVGLFIAASCGAIAAEPLKAFGIGYCAAQLLTLAAYYAVNRRLYRTGYNRRTLKYLLGAIAVSLLIIATYD